MSGVMEEEIPEGFKRTEIGVIPNEWLIKRASEIFVKIQDGTHFSPKLGGNDYMYITSKNIRVCKLNISTAEYIDEKQHKAIYKRCDVKKGDILLTKDGANTGNAALNNIDEEFSLLSSVAFLRVNKKNSAEYCLQQIISPQFQQVIQGEMSGNAITRLTLNKINNLIFCVPSVEEQTAIANALSDVDALITSLEKLINKKRAIKTAAMQQLLTGKKRLPPFDTLNSKEGTPAYKLTELGEIPEDWEIYRLSSLLKENPRYGIGAAAVPLTGKLPVYIRITDISDNGYFRPSKKVGVNRYDADEYVLQDGDLVFARTGASVGKSYLYQEHDGKLVYAGFLIKITPNSNKLFAEYLFQYVKTRIYWNWVQVMSMRSGQPGINGVEYGEMLLPLPKKDEQIVIAKVLSDMDKEIEALETRLNKTQQIKQGMMQELLTGKTRLI